MGAGGTKIASANLLNFFNTFTGCRLGSAGGTTDCRGATDDTEYQKIRVQMRDPKNRDHKMKVSELEALAPNFKFDRFFSSTGAPSFTDVNVVPPDFFQKVNGVVESMPVADWKTYLR